MNVHIILFITILKNSIINNKFILDLFPHSIYRSLALFLYKENLILFYFLNQQTGFLRLFLQDQFGLLKNLAIISTLSLTRYLKYKELVFLSEKGPLFVLSTQKGLQTGLACKQLICGGILLFKF